MCFYLTSLFELAIFSIRISCSSIWCCVICFAYKYELKCSGFEYIFCRILGAYYEQNGTIYLHRIALHHSDLLFVATVCGDCWSCKWERCTKLVCMPVVDVLVLVPLFPNHSWQRIDLIFKIQTLCCLWRGKIAKRKVPFCCSPCSSIYSFFFTFNFHTPI